MQRAVAAGRLQLSWFDQSRLAWRRLEILIGAYEDAEIVRLMEIDATCAAGYLAASDFDASKRQDAFLTRFNAYREAMLPWLIGKTNETTDMLDQMAQWYAMFAPDAPVEGD